MMPNAAQVEARLLERYGDGDPYPTGETIDELAQDFQLTLAELEETDGSHRRFPHKVHSALARHHSLGLLERVSHGKFRYLPEKVAEYEPCYRPRRAHTPMVRKSTNNGDRTRTDDDFPAGDYKVLAALVGRHGKAKLVRVLKGAF